MPGAPHIRKRNQNSNQKQKAKPIDKLRHLISSQSGMMAIAMFVTGGFFIIVMNAFAKQAMTVHGPMEVIFYRGMIALLILLLYAGIKKDITFYKTARLKSHFYRALAGNVGVFLVFWAYQLLPLADVTAVLFASPLIVTMLSAFFLKEQVGKYRWFAVAAGFAGVMLILNPSTSNIGSGNALVPLAAAFSTALVIILLRDLGKTENATTTVFYFLLFGIAFSGVYMIFKGSLPVPSVYDALIGTGVAAIIQLLLKTQAFRIAEASLLSPFSYLTIIWAILFDLMFWDKIPQFWTIIGTAVIIAANLIIIWREQRYKKQNNDERTAS